MHSKTDMPRKKSKRNPLTKEERKKNRQLSRDRVLNENVIGSLKRFKVISDRYRNRRKRLVSTHKYQEKNLIKMTSKLFNI
jgi:hypothetical protein